MKRRMRLRNSECESSEPAKQGLLSPDRDRLPRNASAPHMVVMGRNIRTVFTAIARSDMNLYHNQREMSDILESNHRWDIQLVQGKIFRYMRKYQNKFSTTLDIINYGFRPPAVTAMSKPQIF